MVPEGDLGAEQEQTLRPPAELELGETTGRILEQVGGERPARCPRQPAKLRMRRRPRCATAARSSR